MARGSNSREGRSARSEAPPIGSPLKPVYEGVVPTDAMKADNAFKSARRLALRDIGQSVSLDAEDGRVAPKYTSETMNFQFGGETYLMKIEANVKFSESGGDSNTELSNIKYTIEKYKKK